ncbi:UNVERIFIED_CONTAM: hypothetical protein FKN15_023690 [Acipenser sinensis]
MDQVGIAAKEKTDCVWKSPWGAPNKMTSPCSLADVMSEQLAKQLQLDEENLGFSSNVDVNEPLITGDNIDTASDLMLAKMMQMEFDREFDMQLCREEKKLNGESKGVLSCFYVLPIFVCVGCFSALVCNKSEYKK